MTALRTHFLAALLAAIASAAAAAFVYLGLVDSVPIALAAGLVAGAISGLVSAILLASPFRRMREDIEAVAEGRLARLPSPAFDGDPAAITDAVNAIAERAEARASELAEERAEQASLLSSLQEGVIVLDSAGVVQGVNGLAASWCGIAPDRAAGQPLEALLRHPPVQGLVRGILAGSPEEADPPTIEHDGRLLRVRATRLGDTSAPAGALLVLADITRLERLERIRRDFVANVSHELKTPITAVKGYLETLRDGALEDPETARNFVEIAMRQADRLNAIIEDLLSLSRIEQQTEGDAVERETIGIRDLLAEAVETCLPRADAARVLLRLECNPVITAAVNPALLEQAVLNLVENAIKHTPPGKHVTVRAVRDDKLLKIAVIDEGCGIESQHLGRLFERFYRVDKSRSRQSGGTGLGLSIVMRIARAHGGDVTVQSEVGRGSTFTMAIPA